MNVKRQLVAKDYIKALAVLKAAFVTWPDFEIFRTAENGDRMSANENRYLYLCSNFILF